MKKHHNVKYDIFISYRRTAYNTANLIAEKLRNAGYNVFFDIDTLTGGKFNEQLLNVISHCKDFILILPENALDRCNQTDDWIRREVLCAIAHQKNIVPVMLDGFVWPTNMPKGMEELPNYQAVTAVGYDFFDMAVQRLKGFLKSKPRFPIKEWFIKGCIAFTILLFIISICVAILQHVGKITSEKIASKQASVMSSVDGLNDIRINLNNTFSAFSSAILRASTDEERYDLEEDMNNFLKKTEKDIVISSKTTPPPNFTVSEIETYLLGYYGIRQEELKAFSTYYTSLYADFDDVISSIKDMISAHEYSSNQFDFVKANLQMIEHSINFFYYAYLESLSLFPKSARSKHNELSKIWRHYPNGTPLDLTQEEYEQFQATELNRIDDILYNLSGKVNYEEQRIIDSDSGYK